MLSSESTLAESYIDSQAGLEEACARLAASSCFALDTEFERRNTYYPILAFMQIATESESILIDPLKISDWLPFVELFNSDRLFVMHSCSEDLEVFRKHFGVQPQRLIDTQIACAFLGKGDALGYANMVLTLRGVELDKSETRSNWLQRPLTESQKAYAREDVRWLLGIYAELEQELVERNRLDWVIEECGRMRDKYLQEPEAAQHWLRVKGLGRINRSAWPLAYALADWREKLCRKLDKPRGWIMKDPELLEIAQRQPRDLNELKRVRGITSITINKNSQSVLDLVNKGDLADPPTQPVPELDPSQRPLLKRCQQLMNDRAEALELSARCIANKQDLTELIQHSVGRTELTSALLTGWRKDLIGQELEALVRAS